MQYYYVENTVNLDPPPSSSKEKKCYNTMFVHIWLILIRAFTRRILGWVSGWGCSIANISMGAHTDPKLNKHNAM